MNTLKLLTEKDFRELLGDLGERKFHALRAAGIIPAPMELGPRCPRWTHADYLETLQRLPRRERQAEPQTLAQGRREHIEKLKAESPR